MLKITTLSVNIRNEMIRIVDRNLLNGRVLLKNQGDTLDEIIVSSA